MDRFIQASPCLSQQTTGVISGLREQKLSFLVDLGQLGLIVDPGLASSLPITLDLPARVFHGAELLPQPLRNLPKPMFVDRHVRLSHRQHLR